MTPIFISGDKLCAIKCNGWLTGKKTNPIKKIYEVVQIGYLNHDKSEPIIQWFKSHSQA